ncbi:hypothetical protein LAZ67_3003983 [Cordylochernes scorpioides]|uniref:Uncharacterized protein n=1 Tax=Cordylochernes scorpioides TaxID=51811 RepID=A0ABY6K8Z3_9ARAC|nr:hypothetical protein LAZ67_3003983 [Cordylochernes scorpioides]
MVRLKMRCMDGFPNTQDIFLKGIYKLPDFWKKCKEKGGGYVKLRACLFLDYTNLDFIDDNDANFDKVADLDQAKNIHLTRYVRYGKSNLRIIILSLLLISGIESNPGPKATRQTTLETSMEKDLRELIAALTVKIDDWGSKIESRLSSIELGMQKFDSRVQQLESSLEDTTCAVESNAKKAS